MSINAFSALSDGTRREIVRLVAKRGALSSTDISQNFQMSAPAISQHLKILREAKVLTMKKDAQRRIYSVDNTGMNEIQTWLSETMDLWNNRLDRLEKYLNKIKTSKHGKK